MGENSITSRPSKVIVHNAKRKTPSMDMQRINRISGYTTAEAESNDRGDRFDFYSAMRPITIFGRVLGMGSFPIERGGSIENVPKVLIAYSATVCLACAVMLTISLSTMFETGEKIALKEKEKVFNFYILLICWIVHAFSSFECQLNFFLRRTRIHEVLVEISNLAVAGDGGVIRDSIRRSILFNTLYIAALLGFLGYGSYTEQIPLRFTVALSSAVYLLVFMVCRQTMVAFLLVLRYQFRSINKQVLNLGEGKSWVRGVTKGFFSSRNTSLSLLAGASSVGDAAAIKVSRLAFEHFQLTEFCSQWSSLFGFNFVMISLNTFFSVVCCGYTTVGRPLNLIRLKHFEIEMVCLVGWTLTTVVAFITVVQTCSSASAEANETARAVLRALIKVKDEQLHMKLKDFSTQLLHTKVHFTACDFFEIQKSLYASMGATIATYFIIIIQFQMTAAPPQITNASENDTSDY